MYAYIAKRLLIALPTLIGVTALIFVIMRILPGDPLGAYFGFEEMKRMTEAQKALALKDLGLDRPYIVQYGEWIGNIFTGSLGESLFLGDDILKTIATRSPITIEIGVLSLLIAWLIGLPVGIISAVKPHSFLDAFTSTFTVIFLAIPGFWLGMLVVVSCLMLWQYKSPVTAIQLWENPKMNFEIIIGPAVVLGIGQAAYIARMARSSLFEILREDYVRTARSKGLREWVVISRHGLRNALLPVLTLSGVLLGFLLGGSVAIEQAFTVPGLGQKLIHSAIDRDYNVVQNITLFYAVIFIGVNLGVDLLYAYLDPRIRLS